MGLRFNREDATHGALIVGKVQSLESAFKTTAYNTVPPIPGMDWGLLAASTDGYVLTCSAAAAEGVAWAAPAVPTALSTFTATAGAFSGGIAAWGATLPSAARYHRHGHRLHDRHWHHGDSRRHLHGSHRHQCLHDRRHRARLEAAGISSPLRSQWQPISTPRSAARR